jgi:hypothetical protein
MCSCDEISGNFAKSVECAIKTLGIPYRFFYGAGLDLRHDNGVIEGISPGYSALAITKSY